MNYGQNWVKLASEPNFNLGLPNANHELKLYDIFQQPGLKNCYCEKYTLSRQQIVSFTFCANSSAVKGWSSSSASKLGQK